MFSTSLKYRQERLPAFKTLKILPAYRLGVKQEMTKENTSHHSPKRKRDEPATPKKPSPSTLRTNFTLGSTIEDEQTPAESPRTQVSNRFEGLQLEGHGVSKLDLLRSMPQVDGGMDDLDKVKKKTKFSVLSVNGNSPQV